MIKINGFSQQTTLDIQKNKTVFKKKDDAIVLFKSDKNINYMSFFSYEKEEGITSLEKEKNLSIEKNKDFIIKDKRATHIGVDKELEMNSEKNITFDSEDIGKVRERINELKDIKQAKDEYTEKINNPNDNVATTHMVFKGPDGDPLVTKVYYPENTTEEMPIIIHSHGLGGNNKAGKLTCEELASNGYVVIAPTHTGSDGVAVDEAREANPDLSFLELIELLFSAEELEGRTNDISFLIDNLDTIDEKLTEVDIDSENIGVAGHSFGAATVMALAGADYYTEDGEKIDLADDRIDAFLALSPQGIAAEGVDGFKDGSWDDVDAPVMMVTGTKDTPLDGSKDYTWRLQGYEQLPENENIYAVTIEDASHADMGNGGRSSRANKTSEIPVAINTSALTFFDAYLKDSESAQTYLDADLLKKTQDVVFETDKK